MNAAEPSSRNLKDPKHVKSYQREHLQAIPVPAESRTCDELSSACSHVLELISQHLVAFGDRFPAETCQNGVYPLTENVEWTTSFWTGQLWLAWEMSGETTFREMAEKTRALV